MHRVCLEAQDDVEGWRRHARLLARAGVSAQEAVWQVGGGQQDLFGARAQPLPETPGAGFNVPRAFLELAGQALLHSDPERFALFYALLLRVVADPRLMGDRADPQLRRAEQMAGVVRRDMHKMHAFLRFRAVEDEGGPHYVAWFEPEHHILRANAGFFVDRFAAMRWSILTPRGSLHWDGAVLREGPAAMRGDAAPGDPVEAVWKAYYAAIFNPARLMTKAMLKEMPRKYWHNMPETALVPGLIAGARRREQAMIAQDPRPRPKALDLLREEAASCRRCGLCGPATQTVFGQGPPAAPIMIVGEQPGDREDLAGKPFIGPAGAVFDRALAAAGILRADTYVTNAVKHFKFTPQGKQRLHARPNVGEIDACRWWLDQERAIVRPRLVIAMGATAVRALTGQTAAIATLREAGVMLADGTPCRVTVHPSFLLRLPDKADAAREFARYVADLRAAVAGMG